MWCTVYTHTHTAYTRVNVYQQGGYAIKDMKCTGEQEEEEGMPTKMNCKKVFDKKYYFACMYVFSWVSLQVTAGEVMKVDQGK